MCTHNKQFVLIYFFYLWEKLDSTYTIHYKLPVIVKTNKFMVTPVSFLHVSAPRCTGVSERLSTLAPVV